MKLFGSFIDPKECEEIFGELFNELPWKQKSDIRNGIQYLQPRLTAWYGDHDYRYSGVLQKANPNVSVLLIILRYLSNNYFTVIKKWHI